MKVGAANALVPAVTVSLHTGNLPVVCRCQSSHLLPVKDLQKMLQPQVLQELTDAELSP